MNPVDFPQSNKLLTRPPARTADECGSLAVFTDGEHCISRWQGGWRERLAFLLTGKVWVWVWSGSTQPPVALTTVHPFDNKEER